MTPAGPNSATATQNGAQWVMHMVAFKADTADGTLPTPPTGLTATPASGSKIDLGWTASTDDVGVAGYKIFRNGTQSRHHDCDVLLRTPASTTPRPTAIR